jgi:hypothetical protein
MGVPLMISINPETIDTTNLFEYTFKKASIVPKKVPSEMAIIAMSNVIPTPSKKSGQ